VRSRMSLIGESQEAATVIDLVGGGAHMRVSETEERIRHSLEHLLDAFAAFTAVRDRAGRIIDFRLDYANDAARLVTNGIAGTDGKERLGESLADHYKQELFEEFCEVVETGEPLATQSLDHVDSRRGDKRLLRAFEVRADRIGDGLAVVWRDVTAHVLLEVELGRRNRELTLVGEMVEYLQAAESTDEVFEVAGSFGSRLFGDFSGGLLILNASGTVVEAASSWGESTWGDEVFAPERCWALRRGRRHGSLAGNEPLRCAHASDAVGGLLCVPLIAQGTAIGLLVLSTPDGESRSGAAPSSAASEALAVSVCEHLGLALTNIRLRETLRNQSIRDPLTGLFNLRYLEETLEREISRCARSGKPLGLMMMDIDRFQEFNDTFGHPGGDALLSELGGLLASVTRVEDAACRYGGDEFVVLLAESPLDVTLRRAEEIRRAARRFTITHDGSVLDAITVTVGVAVYPDHATDMAGLLRAADEAMYEAKHAGGDRVQVAQTPG
jgi:diguanylate cyclase (GGDEF)-like protein